MENRILSNIKYTIHNYSNYDISLNETKDIIDVPYFPAQNLVDPNGYSLIKVDQVEKWFLLKDDTGKERVFGLVNKADQRLLFIELADNARYLQYKFGGTTYPQGRSYHSLTTDGRRIYVGFGECNGRCVNDLWVYDIYTNTWTNLNYSIQEQPINQAPSKRRKVNLVNLPSEIWIFGGETDILKIHSDINSREIIPLNDVWVFDKNTGTWTNYDKKRILPHRTGQIVYIDSSVIKIVIEGGINEIGEEEPSAIWTINRETDEVTYEPYTPPFKLSYLNTALFIDGVIHYLVGDGLYKWDNENNQFVLVKSGITTINPETKNYLVISEVKKNRGDSGLFEPLDVTQAEIKNYDTNETLETKTITPPINVDSIPRVNIGNYQTWYLYGIVNQTFNEDIFVLTHQTLQTKKISIPETEKPTERIYPAVCYDRYRNRIWLFGGTDGTKFYNDLWYFDISEQKWVKVFDNQDGDNSNYPAPRQKAGIAVVVNGDFLYLIGGYSDERAFNDFWQLNLKTLEWKKVYLTDNIPFGSQYFIFEWRDRLFLFNGEPDGIYRFYYTQKQFIKQPFTFPGGAISSTLKTLIAQRQYLETPINVTLINDTLFIQNSQVHIKVDLNDRSVLELDYAFGIPSNVQWLDSFKGLLPDTGKVVYVNVSKLYPLTKNQLPASWFSKKIDQPWNSGTFIVDYISSDNQLSYVDETGKYKIQGRVLPIDKAKLLVEGNVSIVGTQSDYPDVDFSNSESVWSKTIEVLANPLTYPYQPWFLYNKNKPPLDWFKGIKDVIYDEKLKRLFLVYESGNIVKLNLNDMTFFVYHPKFWQGSVVAYNRIKNKFWCFGGLRDFYGVDNQEARTPYTQQGFECSPIQRNDDSGTCQYIEKTHCGVIELDVKVNELSLRSIEDYKRNNEVELVDYSITKQYLISIVSKYLEQYETGRINLSLENIKRKIYQATQPLVDDISTLEVVYEKGERPKGRAFSAYTQIGNKVYIFGGCECVMKTGMCDSIINPPYLVFKPGEWTLNLSGDELNKQSQMAVYYDLDNDEWVWLEPLPEWRYMASAISSPDGRFVYIVGGYTDYNCSGASNDIIVYDTQSNKYTKLLGIPQNFKPRANPILHWLDDYHLLIMYGFRSKLVDAGENQKMWLHIPLNDAWILDTKSKIMYKAFEDILQLGGISVRDYYAKDKLDELEAERNQYLLAPVPIQNPDGTITIKVTKYDLTNGDFEVIDIIPTTEILRDLNIKIVSDDFGGEFKPIS